MSRLPIVGGDNSAWGSLLDDYLSQEHTAAGAHGDLTATGLFIGTATTTRLAPIHIQNNQTSNVPGQASGLKIEVSATGGVPDPNTSDFVALYSRIASNAQRQRIWAGAFLNDLPTGLDATSWGLEVDVTNNVAAAPNPRTTGHKLGIDVVSGGVFSPSAAFATNATTSGNAWRYGVWFDGIGSTSTSSALITVGSTTVAPAHGLDFTKAAFAGGSAIRLPNASFITWRNAAGAADLPVISVNSGNNLSLTNVGIVISAVPFLIQGDFDVPFRLDRSTVAVSAPGSGRGLLRWENGTNPGTLKLVGYSGTSTVGATIVDNVGAGN